MHLPDHFLDPATMTVTAIISGGAVAYSLFRVRNEPRRSVLPAAAVGAGIFAAQMVNFPVASATSGHFVGGAMAGLLLGPWAGLLAMAAVLAVQAVIFGDGGILALGANILNMGVICVAVGSGVARLTHLRGANNGLVQGASAVLAGWLSVVAASLACAVEMAIAGAAPASDVVSAMLGIHAIIGLPEGAITAILVMACASGFMRSSRPNMEREKYAFPATLLCATLIVAALSPLASTLPDGLEYVAESFVSLQLADTATVPSVFGDYAIPGVAWSMAATVLAAALGVALVYAVTAISCFGAARSRSA